MGMGAGSAVGSGMGVGAGVIVGSVVGVGAGVGSGVGVGVAAGAGVTVGVTVGVGAGVAGGPAVGFRDGTGVAVGPAVGTVSVDGAGLVVTSGAGVGVEMNNSAGMRPPGCAGTTVGETTFTVSCAGGNVVPMLWQTLPAVPSSRPPGRTTTVMIAIIFKARKSALSRAVAMITYSSHSLSSRIAPVILSIPHAPRSLPPNPITGFNNSNKPNHSKYFIGILTEIQF
jgi:hypothetical protein